MVKKESAKSLPVRKRLSKTVEVVSRKENQLLKPKTYSKQTEHKSSEKNRFLGGANGKSIKNRHAGCRSPLRRSVSPNLSPYQQ
jgi:hypothetical protein